MSATSNQRKMRHCDLILRWNSPSHICNHLSTRKMVHDFFVPFFFLYSHEKPQRWDFFPALQLLTEMPPISPLGFSYYGGRRELLFVQASITSWRIQGPVTPLKVIRALISKKSQVWTWQNVKPKNSFK